MKFQLVISILVFSVLIVTIPAYAATVSIPQGTSVEDIITISFSSGFTARGTPLPTQSSQQSITSDTFYSEELGITFPVPNGWHVFDESNFVTFTPDTDYLSTYITFSIITNDFTYDNLSKVETERKISKFLNDWCSNVTFSKEGFICYNYVEKDLYSQPGITGVTSTYTIEFNDGAIFEQAALFGIAPISSGKFIQIDSEFSLADADLYLEDAMKLILGSNISTQSQSPTTPSSNSSITLDTYHSNSGFSIDFPSGWIVNDQQVKFDDLTQIVEFYPNADSYDVLHFEVFFAHDNSLFQGLSDSQYLNKLENLKRNICNNRSVDTVGFTCSGFLASDELSGSYIDDFGNVLHALYFTYTENYPDASYDIAAAHFEQPQNDGTWIITFYFDMQSYDNYLENINATEFVSNIITSFSVDTSSMDFEGYGSWEEYCKGEFGSDHYYDVEKHECLKLTSGDDNGGGCLIATATYGSELAPQVQMLREIRDNSLLQTESGTNFMNSFNEFYYSFSPYVADLERENPVFKEAVKLFITPMISSLSILNYVNMDSEDEVLGYGISLILLNLAMYVGVPASVIIGVRRILPDIVFVKNAA